MARGVNKCILLGRCGKDPVINETSGGFAIASFSLATSESWKNKVSGEKEERTEWHNITFFGKLADVVRQYVKKGSLLYVEGKINYQKYQDKETGQDKFITKILGDSIQLLDSKKDSEEPKQAEMVDDFGDKDIPF